MVFNNYNNSYLNKYLDINIYTVNLSVITPAPNRMWDTFFEGGGLPAENFW